MASIATTKMSSKGQVVILKNITPPAIEEFDELITKARKTAQQAGLKKLDIKETVMKVRGTK